MYCPDLKVAVEFNGEGHYIFTDRVLMCNRIEKDFSKVKQTVRRGINLLVVPYYIPSESISLFIAQRLQQ